MCNCFKNVIILERKGLFKKDIGNFLAVQELGLHTFPDEGPGSIPSQVTKNPQGAWQTKKQKEMGHKTQKP